MKIIKCRQYSPEYWAAKRGKPSASEANRIVTPKKWEYAAGAQSYICELIADRYDPLYGCVEDYVSAAMKNGTIMEPEARLYYEFDRNATVEQVGLCTTDDERFCCSPDGLVGEDGGLELKSPTPAVHVRWLLAGDLPAEHAAQVHASLIVTGRDWWDWMSYVPGLPPLLVRVAPDEKTEALIAALNRFHEEYAAALAKIEGLAVPPPTIELSSPGLGTESFTPAEFANPIPF